MVALTITAAILCFGTFAREYKSEMREGLQAAEKVLMNKKQTEVDLESARAAVVQAGASYGMVFKLKPHSSLLASQKMKTEQLASLILKIEEAAAQSTFKHAIGGYATVLHTLVPQLEEATDKMQQRHPDCFTAEAVAWSEPAKDCLPDKNIKRQWEEESAKQLRCSLDKVPHLERHAQDAKWIFAGHCGACGCTSYATSDNDWRAGHDEVYCGGCNAPFLPLCVKLQVPTLVEQRTVDNGTVQPVQRTTLQDCWIPFQTHDCISGRRRQATVMMVHLLFQ